MKRIFFFATPSDIVPVLKRFEVCALLKFVEIGNLETPNRMVYMEISQIPNPGISTHETGSLSKKYLVSHRSAKNIMRSFIGGKGESRWTLENGDNEETVVLNMAGLWETGTLLPGSIMTLHETPVAQQLMRWFLLALKKEKFIKIREWWVGHEAMEMLKAGRRLSTTAEQSPPEFDLKLPGKLSENK